MNGSVQAEDRFEKYFEARIWDMIPEIYRSEDSQKGVLRSIVKVIAEQASVLRRSQDRLWEDQFIEMCDDWAVPYLADLVGTRLLPELNKRGRRVDVAKTIYYRRRKGTLRVLEELISDITGWQGTVVENFRTLGRTRHRLDPEPGPFAGRYTKTPPGGTACIRNPHGSDLIGGPFDEYSYTCDVRKHRGSIGRRGITKVVFHIYRLKPSEVKVTPRVIKAGEDYTFDPSGRDIPLFMPAKRSQDRGPNDYPNWDNWRTAREWELPARIKCRTLSHAEYRITASTKISLSDHLDPPVLNELNSLMDERFTSESRLKTCLRALPSGNRFLTSPVYEILLEDTLRKNCGKGSLLLVEPFALRIFVGDERISTSRIEAGCLGDWQKPTTNKDIVIDPDRGRFKFLMDPLNGKFRVQYHYGFSDNIGAGTYDREASLNKHPDSIIENGGEIQASDIPNAGTTQIEDSLTYGPIGGKGKVKKLVLQAANRERPYLEIRSNWILDTGPNEGSDLVLDGLWLGTRGSYSIILRGNYRSVKLRHMTLDPGGFIQHSTGEEIPDVLPELSLIIEGHIDILEINRSITGPIKLKGNGNLGELLIRDSLISEIEIPRGNTIMERVSVTGPAHIHRLWASEVLASNTIQVEDNQTGCFRFGAYWVENNRLPHPYESHEIHEKEGLFSSLRFGDPDFGRLGDRAPEAIRRGGENGSEIGAFNSLLSPIKFDSLQAKVNEYMPFGLIPIYIFQDEELSHGCC